MKNLARILMTFFLLAFTSGAVVHGGLGNVGVGYDGVMNDGGMAVGVTAPYNVTSMISGESSMSRHAAIKDAENCDDCTEMAGASPACHFICAIVVMPEIAMIGDVVLPRRLLTVLPAMDRATGLSHVPDPSPPRMLS